MGKRPAKLAIRTNRTTGKNRSCPNCDNPKMSVVKFVRHSKPSGFYWLCDKCDYEASTK